MSESQNEDADGISMKLIEEVDQLQSSLTLNNTWYAI